jgi:hypothetical protein
MIDTVTFMDAIRIPFGLVPNEDIRIGDHIAYFWETEREFEQGADFLITGLAGRDHCVIFGHDDANARVSDVLRRQSVNVDDYQRRGRLTVVGSESTGAATLSKLGDLFQKAVDDGAQVIRLLGNIGWGKKGWPEEDDILHFEHKVTSAAKSFPAVVVCMYDVNTLSGRVIVQGGMATHPITVCGNVMRVNTHHQPDFDLFSERVRQTSRTAQKT